MRIQKLMFLFILAVAACLTYSCDDDEDTTPQEDCLSGVSYTLDIVPILNQTCAIPNCHVNGFINGDYTTFEDLSEQNDRGALSIQIETGAMPPSNTAGPAELTDDELRTFLCWIEQGALEN